MNRIPKSQIDLVIQAQDISFWAKKYIRLEFKGHNGFGLCPFHSEKSPSFSVNTLKNFFYCFGCQKSGTSVDLVMHFESLVFHEAILFMAEATGITVDFVDNGGLEDQYDEMLKIAKAFYTHLSNNPKAIDYLKSRKITGESAKHFQLGLSLDQVSQLVKASGIDQKSLLECGVLLPSKHHSTNTYCRFRQRIMFPVHNMQGQVIGFGGRDLSKSGDVKYLNSAESKLFSKRNALYGLYQARKSKMKYAYVVEGYFDVIRLWQEKFYGAVAPMGTAITGSQIAILNRYFDKVYFCFDGDRAGVNASEKALIKTLKVMRDGLKVFFITLPTGHDPDSYVATKGIESFQSLADGAPDIFQYLDQRYLSPVEGPAELVEVALKIKPWIQDMPNSMTKQALTQFVAKKTLLEANWIDQDETMITKPNLEQQPQKKPSQKTFPAIWYNLLVVSRELVLSQEALNLLKSHCPTEHAPLLQALCETMPSIDLVNEDLKHQLRSLGFSIEHYHRVLINHQEKSHELDLNNHIIQLTIKYLDTKIIRLISKIKHDSGNQQRLTLNALIHEKNALKQQLKFNLQQGT